MKRNLTTTEIERRFTLSDRLAAVKSCVHAIDYLCRTYGWRLHAINACEVLSDGIKNAVDGRATGDEWRNVRHGYNSERDGAIAPDGKDSRCYECGYIDPLPFEQCFNHGKAQRAAG